MHPMKDAGVGVMLVDRDKQLRHDIGAALKEGKTVFLVVNPAAIRAEQKRDRQRHTVRVKSVLP